MATPPDFTAGQVLTAAQMNQIGLFRITTCTVTSSGGTAATASNGVISIGSGNTSVSINNAFSADYQAYKIICTDGAGSTTANVNLGFGASADEYYRGGIVLNTATGVSTVLNSNDATIFLGAGQMSANGLNLNLEVGNPFLAKFTSIAATYNLYTSGDIGFVNGYHGVASSFTSFNLAPSTGSFSSGKIRVYGYRL